MTPWSAWRFPSQKCSAIFFAGGHSIGMALEWGSYHSDEIRRAATAVIGALCVDPREWSPELFGQGAGFAPPEREWKG